jgi:hypothetical protein
MSGRWEIILIVISTYLSCLGKFNNTSKPPGYERSKYHVFKEVIMDS